MVPSTSRAVDQGGYAVYQQNINNNATNSRPFLTADGWVWFQGTDNRLWRMRTNGSQQSNPGNTTTLTSPTVSVGGWIYFQGTDYYLWRMFGDGSQKIIVDGNWTASALTVSAMSIVNGIPGEWVYWREPRTTSCGKISCQPALRAPKPQMCHITFSRLPTRLRAPRAVAAALPSSTALAARRARLPRPATRSMPG